jgi:uncharacterized membrane protein
MRLRSPRERLIQTLCYEAGGLLLSIPLYLLYSGHATGEGTQLMLALSVAVMVWSPFHNSLFDWADLQLSGRVASDRPQAWRMVHAISHEVSTMVFTVPILIGLGGHAWREALLVDLGLTGLYAVYAYGFHLVYDRLRPIAA